MSAVIVVGALLVLALGLARAVTTIGQPTPRQMWAGSEPITDELERARLMDIWWETYERIDPADRIHHEPTLHWWIYQDADIIPGGFLGYWTHASRAIHVTRATIHNVQLIRHECAHDIMNQRSHPETYFSEGTYIMKQFR